MQNLSDNELDKRFQEAAEKYRPSYDPEAWQHMQKRLDTTGKNDETGATGNYLGRIIPAVLIFLMGSFSGILIWTHFSSEGQHPSSLVSSAHEPEVPGDSGETNSAKDQISASENYTQSDNKYHSANADGDATDTVLSEGTDAETQSGALRTTDNAASEKLKNTNAETPTRPVPAVRNKAVIPSAGLPETRDNASATTSQANGSNAEAVKRQPGEVPHARSSSSPGSETTDTTPKHQRHQALSGAEPVHAISAGESEASSAVSTANESLNDRSLPAKNLQTEVPSAPAAGQDGSRLQKEGPAANATVPSDSTAVAVASTDHAAPADETNDLDQSKEKNSTQGYRLSAILAVSPDFSSVDFGDQTKPGFNYGLLLEYHFSDRISLQTGAMLSKKIYVASNLEYNGHYVTKADGDCRIIDIPLNVYYRFKPGSKISFFTSAGLSSYIMKKEDYTFYVESGYGSYEYDKQVRNENNEWFKVLNFSGGVAKRLTSHASLEAEPFVKIPVSGIGEGRLNVNTFGMFVRFRYSFIKTQ